LKIIQLLLSQNIYFEKFQVLEHCKQKWRFLSLNDGFRLAENTRFDLVISFESATFACLGNVIGNFMKDNKTTQYWENGVFEIKL